MLPGMVTVNMTTARTTSNTTPTTTNTMEETNQGRSINLGNPGGITPKVVEEITLRVVEEITSKVVGEMGCTNPTLNIRTTLVITMEEEELKMDPLEVVEQANPA